MRKIVFIILTIISYNNLFADNDNQNFKALPELLPSINNNNDRIEIVEFLWYGCWTCYNTEKTIHAWLEHKPEYVDFIQIPAVVGQSLWDFHAKFFITLEIMNKEKELRNDIFNEIFDKQNKLNNINLLKDFVKKFNINTDEFEKVFNSFPVDLKLKKYKNLASKYKIFSTPSIYLNGKYQITNNENLINTLNVLSQKEMENKMKD